MIAGKRIFSVSDQNREGVPVKSLKSILIGLVIADIDP